MTTRLIEPGAYIQVYRGAVPGTSPKARLASCAKACDGFAAAGVRGVL